MLGLHYETLFWAGMMVALLFVFGCSLAVVWKQSGKAATLFRWGLCMCLMMTVVVGGYWTFKTESGLDKRDAAIVQKLGKYGITLVDGSDNNRVTVQFGTCKASYGVPAASLVADTSIAPLNAGSGQAVSGCDANGRNLDLTFIR